MADSWWWLYTRRGVEIRLIFRVASNPAREAAIRATHVKREYGSSQAKRGPILPFPDGKTRITVRHDDDVLGWFSGASELRWRQLSPSLIVEPIGAFRAYSAHLGADGDHASSRHPRGTRQRQLQSGQLADPSEVITSYGTVAAAAGFQRPLAGNAAPLKKSGLALGSI